MSAAGPPVSPRGVPSVRTDWLADVARRLAAVGLDRLRAVDGTLSLHDEVDGAPWRFSAIQLSEDDSTAVEFDADLWAPADDLRRPTLRAGFELAPRWDAARGRAVRVRVEIGPRGAVTFDPENWIIELPVADLAAAPRPSGVEAGEWVDAQTGEPVAAGTAPGPSVGWTPPALAGAHLTLRGLEPVVAGESVPELRLGAREAATPGRGLTRLRARRPRPLLGVLVLQADGPLEAAWTGTGSIGDTLGSGLTLGLEEPVLAGNQLTLRGSAGVLTLAGEALRGDLLEPASAQA